MKWVQLSELNETLKSVKLFKLADNQLAALIQIQSLPADKKDQIATIFLPTCQSITDYVRMAIYSKAVRQWCRSNHEEIWLTMLQKISRFEAFQCEFKPLKKLSTFELLAELILINEYLREERPNQKHTILWVAMTFFYSCYAATHLAADIIVELKKSTGDKDWSEEKTILPMTQCLEKIASIQGCPGYLIFSLFNQRLGEHYLSKGSSGQAAAALYLGYQYLLAAAKLATSCDNELFNACHGKPQLFIKSLHSDQPDEAKSIAFPDLIESYKNRFRLYIKPDEIVIAQKRANLQAQEWKNNSRFGAY